METNRAIQVLSFGLGILMLFHGVNKLSNGVEHIVKMLTGAQGFPMLNMSLMESILVKLLLHYY